MRYGRRDYDLVHVARLVRIRRLVARGALALLGKLLGVPQRIQRLGFFGHVPDPGPRRPAPAVRPGRGPVPARPGRHDPPRRRRRLTAHVSMAVPGRPSWHGTCSPGEHMRVGRTWRDWCNDSAAVFRRDHLTA